MSFWLPVYMVWLDHNNILYPIYTCIYTASIYNE